MATIEELAGCAQRRCQVRIIDEMLNIPAGYKVLHRNQKSGEQIKFFYRKDFIDADIPIGNLILAWIVHEVHDKE